MADQELTTLMPAMEIAAFRRRPDGAFAPLAPHPVWFAGLIADATFPFLGHILEEAVQFWESGATGRRDWGPCEEVDEAGRPFHYKVTALSAAGGQYLLFQLDPESDRMREALQRVRADALAATYQSSAEADTLLAVQSEVQRVTSEIGELARQIPGASSRGAQEKLASTLSERGDRLAEVVNMMVTSVQEQKKR